MRNLILLITRYGATILFILLEVVAFYLIINYNKSQKEIWVHSANLFSGSVNQRTQTINDYLLLRKRNDSLLVENARLLEKVINYRITSRDNLFDRLENEESLTDYKLIPARICNQTIHVRNNFLTLCSGRSSGIRPGMGVISSNGIVGIVQSASDNYANVIMVIHSQSRISAAVKSSSFHGNLVWRGSQQSILTLEAIPKHAEINIGDTIITSGYSVSFPPLLPIGKIMDYKISGGSNSYDIKVEIFNDLRNLEFVYVVDFLNSDEKSIMIKDQNG